MRWLRDPIVLFLALGIGLAALYLASRRDHAPLERDTQIVVTDADVSWLAQVFRKTWNRPPTREELRRLVDRRVRDEMLYREAVALDLDQGDEALRRRVAMKLEFLAKDAGAAIEPTEAQLQAHLDANAEKYAVLPMRRFLQVYVSTDRRGDRAEADAEALLDRLRENPGLDLDTVGDPMLLEREQPLAPPSFVERSFGKAFADAVFALEGDGWHGPVRSGYGLHLVRVDERTDGGAAPLELVRDRVRNDLVDVRRESAVKAYVEALREKYEVVLQSTLLEESPE